jgi:H/ACA ribonucleoprotein complex subunit 4
VSGVLPIGLGEARKLMRYLTGDEKEYICVAQLHDDVRREEIEEVVSKFKGRIYQRPPVRSSVKRRLRVREVREVRVLEFQGRLLLMRVVTEAGTYVRKLCHDIGVILGVGAHMRELRRVRSGVFREESAVTLQRISEAVFIWRKCGDGTELNKILIPMEYGTCGIPKVIASDYSIDALAHGAPLMAPGVLRYQDFQKGQVVAVLTQKGELVALGKAQVSSEELSRVDKGIVVALERVFIPPGYYPKYWK